MNNYTVEIDWDEHTYVTREIEYQKLYPLEAQVVHGSSDVRKTITIRVSAYSVDQIREMFKAYRLVAVREWNGRSE